MLARHLRFLQEMIGGHFLCQAPATLMVQQAHLRTQKFAASVSSLVWGPRGSEFWIRTYQGWQAPGMQQGQAGSVWSEGGDARHVCGPVSKVVAEMYCEARPHRGQARQLEMSLSDALGTDATGSGDVMVGAYSRGTVDRVSCNHVSSSCRLAWLEADRP